MTRRALLATTSAIILAAVLPAEAMPPFKHGGHPQGGGVGAPLAVTLAFADGNTLSFNQTGATDIGDYVGPFVHQKCLRQRASGNGDYRDAFTAYFRPDADGSRSEFILEYGCELNFSASVAAAFPIGSTPPNLFVPPVPTLTKTTGNTSGQSGLIVVNHSYVFADGESVPSAAASLTLVVGDRAITPSAPQRGGATAYRVYAGFVGLSTFLQAELPIGTDWTEPTTGIVTSGTTEKTRTTSTAYTATISGGVLGSPVTIPVKNHWTLARWRWQSAPRPTVRTYSDLVALKAIFPMDAAYLFGAALPPAATWGGPMDNGGILAGFPTTGDRPELGFINDWVAAWLMTGNAAAQTSWRAAAEATGTFQWWIRDAATGTWPNLTTYPFLAWSTVQAAKYKLPQNLLVKSTCANNMQLDQAHMPDSCFVPWLLTDDPYFLEAAQAEALYAIMAGNQNAVTLNLNSLISTGQPRGYAWGIRSMFRMAGYAPVSVPSWLQPQSYFAATLPNNLTYANLWVSSTNPQEAVFGSIAQSSDFPAFQQAYIDVATAWVKYCGKFSSWDAVVDYTHKMRLAISDPTDASGWDHRVQSMYYWTIQNANLGASATNGALVGDYSTAPTANTATSFAQWWTDFVLNAPVSGQYAFWTNPSTWAADTLQRTQVDYLPWIRASLAAIALGGSVPAATANAWLASHIVSDLPAGIVVGNYRWAFSPV